MQETKRITNLSAEDLEAFFLLLPRIYSDYRDPRRGSYEMGFIFANVPASEDSSFLRAIGMANAGAIRTLGISEGAKGLGYEGFDHSVERLMTFGWKDQVPIVKLIVEEDGDGVRNVNTGSEAQVLARYAGGIKGDVALIYPPFHPARAFMTMVTALRRNDVVSRVYSVPGVPLSWSEKVPYGQKGAMKTRGEMLVEELERLEKYRAPEFGGMLSAQEVSAYLDWRDN